MNILITGGTGFLGAHLARELCGSHKLYLLSRNPTRDNLRKLGVRNARLIRCDLTRRGDIQSAFPEGIGLVIHCAGRINVEPDRCPEGLAEANLTGTVNLIEAMIDKSAEKLFFASSMTVYSPHNKMPVNESGRLEPVHFYGLTKKWAEGAIQNYAKKGFIKALIFRYPGLFGYPRSGGYLHAIASKLLKGQDVIINASGLRFWEAMNIEDAAQITRRALTAWNWDKQCAVFNCSYGEETDFVETAFKAKKMLNSGSRLEVKGCPSYSRFFLDNRRLKKMFKKFDYNFDQGLKKFLRKQKQS